MIFSLCQLHQYWGFNVRRRVFRAKAGLLQEKEGTEAQIKALGVRVNEWIEQMETAFNFARYARYWFENGSPQDKRAIMRALSLNLVLEDRKLHIKPPSLFLLMQEAAKQEPSITEGFEPEKSGLKLSEKANLEEVWNRSPALSGG